VVVMQHPVTTEYEDSAHQIQETVAAAEELRSATFWFWPNVDAGSDLISKGLRVFREAHDLPFLYFFKNLAPEDFLRLLRGANCLIGNSSVGIREAAHMGVPVVNIGSRQSGRDRGPNVLDVPHDRDAIVEAVRKHIADGPSPRSSLYGDGHAGERIAGLLAEQPLRIEKRIRY
jgi:UDP-N-acetylglucosamine 2-epimerase